MRQIICFPPIGLLSSRSQKIPNSVYRMQHKIVTSLEWKCCPGFSGPKCQLKGIRFDAWDGAQGWCTGKTLRDGMGKEVGGRFRMGNTCTPMADSYECMAVLFVGPLTEVIQYSSAWYSDPSSPGYLPDTKSPCRQWVLCLVSQSCPTLCIPMDCSLPGSSVHGIFQARILEWVVIPFSRGTSQPRD